MQPLDDQLHHSSHKTFVTTEGMLYSFLILNTDAPAQAELDPENVK